jgi:hypothetical protein
MEVPVMQRLVLPRKMVHRLANEQPRLPERTAAGSPSFGGRIVEPLPRSAARRGAARRPAKPCGQALCECDAGSNGPESGLDGRSYI